jgi:RNA 3'-terminal phosphate cyclase (ATP)
MIRMIEIDGSQKGGSGTILRFSVALAGILGEPLHIFNIRKRRSEPGLRPQHLEAVLTAARLCDATVRGASLGSQELWFEPRKIRGGRVEAEIGTAGSIPMLILTVLPLCTSASQPVDLHVTKGGTDVSHSPTINYLRFVLLPALEQIGVKASIEVQKYGYYPKGMGEIRLKVYPCKEISQIRRVEFGKIIGIEGISVCTFLADRKVAGRQAREAEKLLAAQSSQPRIEVVDDFSNPIQKGSSLVLWSRTDTGVLLGGDAIGEIRKSSETVAQEAVKNLLSEIWAGATMDVHLADMIIPYMALAKGESEYLARMITDHIESNLWLASTILGADFKVEKKGKLFQVMRKH